MNLVLLVSFSAKGTNILVIGGAKCTLTVLGDGYSGFCGLLVIYEGDWRHISLMSRCYSAMTLSRSAVRSERTAQVNCYSVCE